MVIYIILILAKFSLSLDSGNLEYAYKAAVEIRDP